MRGFPYPSSREAEFSAAVRTRSNIFRQDRREALLLWLRCARRFIHSSRHVSLAQITWALSHWSRHWHRLLVFHYARPCVVVRTTIASALRWGRLRRELRSVVRSEQTLGLAPYLVNAFAMSDVLLSNATHAGCIETRWRWGRRRGRAASGDCHTRIQPRGGPGPVVHIVQPPFFVLELLPAWRQRILRRQMP